MYDVIMRVVLNNNCPTRQHNTDMFMLFITLQQSTLNIVQCIHEVVIQCIQTTTQIFLYTI